MPVYYTTNTILLFIFRFVLTGEILCANQLSNNSVFLYLEISSAINLQATKLFIVTSATKGGWLPPPLRFCVRFKIFYRVIQPLSQHCLLHKMVYFNIIYVIATRSY